MVTGIAMHTEIGKSAALLGHQPQVATPLRYRLARVGRPLPWLCLAVTAVVAAEALHRGRP